MISTRTILSLPTQRPGEARPMTNAERQLRRECAERRRKEADKLTSGGHSITLTITPISMTTQVHLIKTNLMEHKYDNN